MIRKKAVTTKPSPVSTTNRSSSDYPGMLSLAAAILLFAAFPPIGFSWCGWLAPIPLLLLVRPPGRSPRGFYGKIWAGAAVHWLVMLEGIRKAHLANYLGLVALAFYVATYIPLFVAITRRAVHDHKIPLLLAAPSVWTGLELVRGYLFTGFSIALLGHTQVDHVWLIQISDLTGAYGLSFLVMLVAVCVMELLPKMGSGRRWLPAVVALGALAVTGGYGAWRLQTTPAPVGKPLRVVLVQGKRDKVFEYNAELERNTFASYVELTKQARNSYADLDLIVWPESAFTGLIPEFIVHGDITPPPEVKEDPEKFRKGVEATRQAFARKARTVAAEANQILRNGEVYNGNAQLIVGVGTVEFQENWTHQRNSVLQLDADGQIVGRYYKMHPVMFGEYVPFGRMWPWLYSMFPMPQGLTPGDRPASFEVRDYSLSPSVCFESTVPHVIRKHVRRLRAETGRAPDVLVNVTDDGWFQGASILDFQLACGVFRAVELRTPFIVAANTGITAAVDGNGRVLDRLPRRQEGIVFAEIVRDGRFSLYERWGDVFAGICVLACLWWSLPVVIGHWSLVTRGKESEASDPRSGRHPTAHDK